MPITNQQEYARAQSLVDSGTAKDPARLKHSMQFYRSSNPQEFLDPLMPSAERPEDITQNQTFVRSVAQGPAKVQGSHAPVDMGQEDSVHNYLVGQVDDQRFDLVSKIRAATQDQSLKNSSKLKVFTDPPEYEPPPDNSPFSALESVTKPIQYWEEPTVEEFKAALEHGALGKQLTKELNEFPQARLEDTETFKAYQDAAWRHAYAEAMKTRTPLLRMAYSDKATGFQKGEAAVLDPLLAGASGALSGASMGLSEPAMRAVAPNEAETERRSRLRNPGATQAGEIAGAVSPVGLASRAATVASKGLGALGLGNKGVQGVVKGLAAGAATGALDANVRAIAQSAADALDAGDSAVEAAKRIYGVLSPAHVAERSVVGGGAGLVGQAAGEALGLLANKGARAVVEGDALPMLQHGSESGVAMGPLGGPKLPKDLETRVTSANARRANADELLADEAVGPMANQRLVEQENSGLRAEAETSAARERLGDASIPTGPVAQDIKDLANSLPAATPQGQALQKNLRRLATKLGRRQKLTAEELDSFMEEVDSWAKQATGKPDPVINKVSSMLKGARDDLGEATAVDNFAIRDAHGNNKAVSGYSGMKARQSNEQRIQEFDNRQMGLPEKLKAEPVQIGRSSATDKEAGEFLGKDAELARVQRFLNEDRAVASRLERGQTPQDLTPTRVSNAIESAAATNRALRKAVDEGYVHNGVIYRGAAMTPDQVSKLVSDGTMTSDSVWSAAKDRSYAEGFALKAKKGGRDPVVFEIEGPAGVPLDEVPGSNTFQELGIPTGERFNVLDSYRDTNGVLVVRLGSTRPTANDLASAAEPKARLDYSQRAEFKGKILGTADPKNAISSEKLKGLAERAGVLGNIKDIQRLRDAQNWKQYLGKIINGISSGGGTYVKSNQLLRAAPTLKSLSGGLPDIPEASPEAIDAVDKLLRNLVPEAKFLNLRGGQAARVAGASRREKESKIRDDMTEEEAQFALTVMKNILEREGK